MRVTLRDRFEIGEDFEKDSQYFFDMIDRFSTTNQGLVMSYSAHGNVSTCAKVCFLMMLNEHILDIIGNRLIFDKEAKKDEIQDACAKIFGCDDWEGGHIDVCDFLNGGIFKEHTSIMRPLVCSGSYGYEAKLLYWYYMYGNGKEYAYISYKKVFNDFIKNGVIENDVICSLLVVPTKRRFSMDDCVINMLGSAFDKT